MSGPKGSGGGKSTSTSSTSSRDTAAAANVRVIARIRPLAKYEIGNGSKQVVSALQDSTTLTETVSTLVQIDSNNNKATSGSSSGSSSANNNNNNNNNNENKKGPSNNNTGTNGSTSTTANKRWFEFDAVFDGSSTQDDVYTKSGIQNSIVNDLFQGYNATILAYGQTGAGKTYTMGNANDGLIPRCCQDVFDTIDMKCDDAVVEISYLEIYNEEIRDLLSSSEPSTDNAAGKTSSTTTTPSLRLREMVNGEVYAEGLTCQKVTSSQQIQEIMDVASSKRMVAATAMNATSSRSHAMAIITITGILRTITTTANGDATATVAGPETTTVCNRKFKSKLTLVDLAGSERIKKTGAAGDRRSEGININKSLLVLGQVVAALAEQATTSSSASKRSAPKRKPPYRDSKLTRLLQDSLGGNSRTIMIACVSPADYNIDESINTLRYATTARSIQNTATQNIVQALTPEEVAKLQRENQLLKLHVDELQRSVRLLSDVSTTPLPPATTTTTAVTPPNALSPKTVVDTANFDDDERTMIHELQAKIAALENELKNSANQEAPLDFQKAVSDTILELPALKVEVEQLREDVKDMEAIESENEYLRRELKEARIETHAAQAAATKLSNIMDKLQELKTDEIDKKRMTYNSIRKEEGWVQLLVDMLSTRQEEMKNLEEDFALVVRVIERCTAEQQQQSALTVVVSDDVPPTEPVESAPMSPQRSYSDGTGPALSSPKRSWFKSSIGSIRSKALPQQNAGAPDDTPAEIRQLLLKQHVSFFRSKMEEISECITVEEESIRTIRGKLRNEREEMELEIGIDEFVKDSLCSKDEDLLQQLTKVLIGPIQRV